MGQTVTPQTFQSLPECPVSLVGLFFVIITIIFMIIFAVSFYLNRIYGFDADATQLAAIPGSISHVVALAAEYRGAHRPRVAAVQIIRFTALLIMLRLILDRLGDGDVAQQPCTDCGQTALVRTGLLLVIGGAGGRLAQTTGMTAGTMTGAMLAAEAVSSGPCHGSTTGEWLLLPGFVIMGAIMGATFAAADRWFVPANLIPGRASMTIARLISPAFAFPCRLDLPICNHKIPGPISARLLHQRQAALSAIPCPPGKHRQW